MGPSNDAARMSGQLSKPKRGTEGEGTRGCKGPSLEKMEVTNEEQKETVTMAFCYETSMKQYFKDNIF